MIGHTAISHWLAAGLGSLEVSRFAGTSTRMVDATYAHLVAGHEVRGATTAERSGPRMGRKEERLATLPGVTNRSTMREPAGWAILGSNQ